MGDGTWAAGIGRWGRSRSLALALLALGGAALAGLGAGAAGGPARAQPLPSATPSPTVILPPPLVAGAWSITRTWARSCPGCSFSISRTTTWQISQFGIDVRVDKGPRGTIVGAPDGTGLMNLEGVESSGPDVYRFLYSTLRVTADGNHFEGGFNGTESIGNPCGEEPPLVTCFASGGYLRAVRLGILTPMPTPPGPPLPTGLPSPFPLPSGTVTPPASATPIATPTATTTPTDPPSATPAASPTARPPAPSYLPIVLWEP
jgi:hypothetical protein